MAVVMNAERFAALADAYGGDLRRWPDAEREAARVFHGAEFDRARGLLEQAGDLDAALDLAPQIVVSPALRARVLRHAPRAGLASALSLRVPTWLAPSAGLAAACIMGAWLGTAASHRAESQITADRVLVASADLAAADPEVSDAR
jgi:hypothetical protein